jgi:flavin reductase (DIM6/NTAB) family NADH-FMN oxidoreductase RutF
MISFEPHDKTIPELFGLMLDAIAPRPIAFASTIDNEGKPNLSPFSFFNTFGANPPIIIFSPSLRGKDSTSKNTLDNVKLVPEVVINIVNYSMIQQINLASTEYKKGVNEFEKAGFTPLKSDLIRPFRVKESPVQLECKVINIIETGTGGAAGNLVICEIVKFHYQKGIFDENGKINPDKIDLVGRMGRDYYVRASGDSIFTLNKPEGDFGIGVDALPSEVKLSKVLTGNDLGILGGLKKLPELQEIDEFVKDKPFYVQLSVHKSDKKQFIAEKHKIAHSYIEKNKAENALKILLFNFS